VYLSGTRIKKKSTNQKLILCINLNVNQSDISKQISDISSMHIFKYLNEPANMHNQSERSTLVYPNASVLPSITIKAMPRARIKEVNIHTLRGVWVWFLKEFLLIETFLGLGVFIGPVEGRPGHIHVAIDDSWYWIAPRDTNKIN